jgi:hypothetical protein
MVAVAASLLTAAYHILKHGVEYRDLGADHFERRDKAKLAKRLIQRLDRRTRPEPEPSESLDSPSSPRRAPDR